MLTQMLKLAFLFIIIAGIGYWQMFSAVDFGKNKSVLFKINAGENFSTVAANLEKQDLIRSNNALVLLAKIRGAETQLKPGRYQLYKSMNVKEILTAITNPKQIEISVTIPEGFSVREIDERLTEMGLINSGEFSESAQNLEGYLFPDTYFVFANNFNPQNLIKKMQDNFLKKVTPELINAAKKQNRELSEILTMASILEKEVKTEKDYPLVAGILWKRLDSDWPLQADATLLYGKTSPNNPYNTYKKRGLVPTPIGNPGIKTIASAIFPEDSVYWFYLTDNEGNVHYARTNEEQNENRKKYLDL